MKISGTKTFYYTTTRRTSHKLKGTRGNGAKRRKGNLKKKGINIKRTRTAINNQRKSNLKY